MNDDGDCYYAVIFTAEMTEDLDGYEDMARKMRKLVEKQPGYIAMHHSMEGKQEVTISYWEDLESIKAWKQQPEHRAAQELGRSKWYANYEVQFAKIDKFYKSRQSETGHERL